ncbi:MAG: hypothetical protein A3G87_01860 [Omnitrophica bacterium RIFCSPLOWO2_12_FULL_50_11]|nr:MAG: hypothetical protein A3G87_01860 [Omnitrophica bacterium RIFCSPLOWO2_12_FULL_50_11]
MGSAALVFVYTFWTAFFTALSVREFFFKEESPVSKRLSKLIPVEGVKKTDAQTLLVSERSDEAPSVKRLRANLLLAGYKRRSDLEKSLLLRRICYVTPLVALVVMYLFLHVTFQTAMIASTVIGIGFVIIPQIWLMRAISKHRKEIKRYLPDTLDLFVIALEAGLSFDSALLRIGEEQRRLSTHISREFLYTNHEILVGKPREEALRGLAKRCGIQEVESFVRAVLQSNRLGSSLVKTLRGYATTLRKKRKQEIQSRISKAPVKLIFPLLFFIFPVLLILILAPSLVHIWRLLAMPI